MSANDDDVGSPNKKPRMEIMTNSSPPPPPPPTRTPSATDHLTTSTVITATPPEARSVTAAPCFVSKETATPCLEAVQKESIIAQILAGTEGGDFGEASFCPPGVFFDESCYSSTGSETAPAVSSYGAQSSWAKESLSQPVAMSGGERDSRSLVVCMESRSCSLHHSIEEVVADHEVMRCTVAEALPLCNQHQFQLIWLQLPCPPSEDLLAVITGIRYSSKLNRKTIQLGVAVTQPEIDLNLHGIDEILLEPVSRSTIRQKYFDWTSVKLTPDYELSLRHAPMSPTTPESSVSTESTIELSLSSLASDTTNDSGIQGEMDVADLKAPTPFLFPQHQGSNAAPSAAAAAAAVSKSPRMKHSNGRPSTPPSWCRVEHATKEKHRSSSQVHRERIKDSCDQLRVLLPYVRGRKTDMASILEMTVDYLKIVNSNLPHEFHAHVLDVMTKGGNSPPVRPARAPVTCGRGSRGGRGRGARRSTTTSPPARPASLQDCGSQARIITRAMSRGMMSSPVSIISRVAGNGNSRGSRMTRRSSQQSVLVSPGSQGVATPVYLLEGKERGPVRQETIITNTMTLPTFLPSSHYAVSHGIFNDTSPSSSSSSSSSSNSTTLAAAVTHAYAPPPGLSTMVPASSSSSSTGSSMDCGLPVPRLYASAHLTVEPSFLTHGHMGNPPPLTSPMGGRYSLGGAERGDGGVGGSFGDPVGGGAPLPPPPPPPPPPAYFHYFSNMPDVSPAYTMAGGGGGGGCVPLCGEFMAASGGGGGLHPLTSGITSAFTPPARFQLAPSRVKGDVTPQSGGLENGGESVVYTLMDTVSKTSK